MASMCKVQIIGNLGKDPEKRYMQDGTANVTFTVAVNQRRRNPDGSYEDETEWFRVRTFGRLADVCEQYLTKGSPVWVDGRLKADRWTGQDGQPRFNLDILANDVQFLSSRQSRDGADGGTGEPTPIRTERPAGDGDQTDLEDLPF